MSKPSSPQTLDDARDDALDKARVLVLKLHTYDPKWGLLREIGMEDAVYGLQQAVKSVDLLTRIQHCATAGKVGVIESGRDCDGVEYDGKMYIIDATAEAYHTLEDEIGEGADGPFQLDICSLNDPVEYTSRDLVIEALEEGHPGVLLSKFW